MMTDNGWRPIGDSPPPRGKMVLLSIPGFCWGSGFVGDKLDDPHNREWHPIGCEIEIVDGLDYYWVSVGYFLFKLATHWMPLPEPLKKKKEEDELT